MNNELFYIQNGNVKDKILWLDVNDGYSIDLQQAKIFTEKQIKDRCQRYPELNEIAWPINYINSCTSFEYHKNDSLKT